MKRWLLSLQGYQSEIKVYAQTPDKAKEYFKGETVIDVQPYADMLYLDIIEDIKTKSKLFNVKKIKGNKSKEYYKCKLQDGILYFILYKDENDGLYYDILEYQFWSNDRYIAPITFVYSNPADTYNLFFVSPLSCEIPIYRFYGQPKMSKPSELKNVKQAFSAEWNEKCECQCFIKGNDLWIKHRDFFSASHKPNQEDMGTPINYRLEKYFGMSKSYLDKFIYPDCWSEIVLRNEAWIVFRNIKQAMLRNENMIVNSMSKAYLQSNFLIKNRIWELGDEWRMFFEKVAKEYAKYRRE